MKQTWDLVKSEARQSMHVGREDGLVMLWLLLLTQVAVSLWATLALPLSHIVQTHIVKTHLAVRISTKISIWMSFSRVKLRVIRNSIMMRFGRQ